MGSCRVELPVGGDSLSLVGRLDNYLQNMGDLAQDFVADAAKEFFQRTNRWRQVDVMVQLEPGDQQIDIEVPEGIGARVNGTIGLRVGEQEGGRHDRCDEFEVYRRKDGSSSYSRNEEEFFCGYDEPMSYYEPHPGTVIFSEPLTENCTYRIELILWPITLEGIDCVPEKILSMYRDGIVSLAIVKAMEMPGKAWSKRTKENDPDKFAAIHYKKAEKHIASARRYHTKNVNEARPFGSRYSASQRTRNSRRRGYYVFGRGYGYGRY